MKARGVIAAVGAVLMFGFAATSAQATFPGQNGPIVFSSFDGEITEIYRVQPDGSGFKQLSIPGAGVSSYRPAISADSRKVAYTRDEAGPPEPGVSRTQIHLMNLNGTGDVRLTSGAIGSDAASFSPDGAKIVFSQASGSSDSIASINIDGTGFTELYSNAVATYPAYSPDGSQIAFFAPGGIWLMNADGSDPHLIAPGQGRPSWSPDGSRIAFSSWYVEVGGVEMGPGIHTIKPDGTDRVNEVPTDLPNQPWTAAYSPDGESLAYVNEYIDFPFTDGLPPRTIRIHALASGTSVPVPLELSDIQQVDWGVSAPLPPTCETDPALCPPPPPAECKMRFTKSRFFVFRKKPVYRLVTKYYSADSGEVRVAFFRRNADGSRGRSLGRLNRNFQAEGRFRIRMKVSPKQARQLRRSKTGFIADFRILPREGFCEKAASLDLTRLVRVKKQYVWFMQD